MEKSDERNKESMLEIPCDETGGCLDPLFEQVVKNVKDSGYATVSKLQRDFFIGYSRACRLMDQLEAAGIIGSQEGVKPRKVLDSQQD